jgi:uncharacterized membrane protein YheB (UPF0754 family)
VSRLWLDLITIPIFSAVAGVLVNWSGIYMLFSPVRFHGVYLPGLKTLFPFLPRRIQVLPLWAPGGMIGYQGFIPARAQKMAAMVVHNIVSRIGTPKDFVEEFAEPAVVAHMVEVVGSDLRPIVSTTMQREHPELWAQMSPGIRESLFDQIAAKLPVIADRALAAAAENADKLIDLRLMAVRSLTANQQLMNRIAKELAGPELRLMIRIGLLGFPLGAILAVLLHWYPHVGALHAIPPAAVTIVGAMLIGMTVNLIAVKVAFEPAERQPWYRYPWRQAQLAKRQHEAAQDFGQLLANEILTFENIAWELLHGPRGDRTMGFVEELIASEVDETLGHLKDPIRVAVGAGEFDALLSQGSTLAADYGPMWLNKDEQFLNQQRIKVAEFGTQKLRALPPREFVAVIYAMIEQDAWLLYAHGAALGSLVGLAHIATFGA